MRSCTYSLINHWIRWYNVTLFPAQKVCSMVDAVFCWLLSKIHMFPFCPVIAPIILLLYVAQLCFGTWAFSVANFDSLGLHSFLILMHASWQQGYVATFNGFIEKLVYLDICWSSVLDQGPHELSRRLFLEP